MSDVVIRAEALGKLYRIGRKAERPDSLLGAAAALLGGPIRNFKALRALDTSRAAADGDPAGGDSDGLIRALRDVSFEVRRGEVLGVIGRNGAGKSTLLKILSRVTEPTSGRVRLRGRVASLLEVGTGFNPELTGRENIFLNGTILGMTRREIERKFDEIVAFSGVAKFLDTPVKRYSSGMRVRLAFAVAAHLEPEILIIDEVLAVGDANFQKKCLGKMDEVSRSGRTILFVSHTMATVQALCSRVILLDRGGIRFQGPTDEVVRAYMDLAGERAATVAIGDREDRQGGGALRFQGVAIDNGRDGPGGGAIRMDDDVRVRVRYRVDRPARDVNFAVAIKRSLGQVIYRSAMRDTLDRLPAVDRDGELTCRFRSPRLLPGRYFVSLAAIEGTGEPIDLVVEAAAFDVEPADVYGTGKFPQDGMLFPDCRWALGPPGAAPPETPIMMPDAPRAIPLGSRG